MNEPWITVGLKLNSKDRVRPGLCSEDWVLGKKESIPLGPLVAITAKKIIDFYCAVTDTSTTELNEQIQKAARMIGSLKVSDRPEVKK